ncbi:outer membrane protein assembly factor BamC [Methylobacillus flagellatus]|uniref:outer membrane protein assembly factor BamC n=1 Tax=Methylobacillus flagellatus TaxID=405 RepID=UPI0010F6F4FC|nr:outer membrane protein assembly factor BamC [Methylobacillus flagellatus]
MNQPRFKRATGVKLLIGATVLATLSGCESIPFLSKTSEYKTAGRAKPLEVPPDLTSVSAGDTYSVPGGATTFSDFSQTAQGPAAETEQLLANPDNVRMERAGAQRWLVVEAPPEKIWPVVREFWADLGFAVRVENLETGVMETEWADATKLKKDEKLGYLDRFDKFLDGLSGLANRQKFRTRLERGASPGYTEIYLTHRTVTTAPDDGKVRQRTPFGEVETGFRLDAKTVKQNEQDADLDAELLRRLMVRLGVAENRARDIVANPQTERRASIRQDNNTISLLMNDPFDRSWRQIGLALDRVGFVVEDRDRSKGLYYVRYSEFGIDDAPEEKKGLLDKLKFWGDEKPEPEKPASERPVADPARENTGVVDKLKFWKSKEEQRADAERQYLIKVATEGTGTLVDVTDKDGNHSNTSNRIINLLYEQLR